MAIKQIPALENYHSYPVVMSDGSIKELCHVEGRFFNSKAVDLSDQVSYLTYYVNYSRTKI